jgi:hypothetical protein
MGFLQTKSGAKFRLPLVTYLVERYPYENDEPETHFLVIVVVTLFFQYIMHKVTI